MGIGAIFARVAPAALAALLCACGVLPLSLSKGQDVTVPLVPVAPDAASPLGSRWIPTAGESYQIQYSGKLDLSVAAQIYDLDMFDTPASVVKKLHGMGRRVMCYVDVGTWERWRPDAHDFPKSVLGKPDGHWPGERWLDIRATKILEPIMGKRLDLCKSKGFDGVDPDNLDGYQNRTGFPLTYVEQLAYDTWVADAAHKRGLTADQKGDNGQVKDLVKAFDFAVVEQCYVQGWCKQFDVYSNANRLVVDVEYYSNQRRFLRDNCPEAAKNHDTAILKKLQLTAWILTCPH
ncbi:MAG: endo alpha-1,4 polygalactosaminidase [Candidatus Eremiobacteraeota bacterium]|nr:endo alpha-1,4 polygalactosaminidase [Candidatus Eremiobacteraeota bacterium]